MKKSLHLCLLLLLLPTLVQAAGLSVFAASSLTEVLREAAQLYQKQHPDDKIQLHFAGSQALATQIEQGAPADLFIAANTTVMERLRSKGLVAKPGILLGNRLILALRQELSPRPTSIRDLARPDLLLAIGNRQVPIGGYTRQLFGRLAQDSAYGPELVGRIEKNIVTEENMVKAIVAKLLLGEVDAGIIYQSDLSPANTYRLIAVTLPQQHNPRASYPMAKVTESRAATEPFMAFLTGSAAQQIFTRHGFLPGVVP